MVDMESENSIVCNAVQSRNAPLLISVIANGIVFNDTHPRNASYPINIFGDCVVDFTEDCESSIVASFGQYANALLLT